MASASEMMGRRQETQPLVHRAHESDKGIYGEDAREEELLVQGTFHEGTARFMRDMCLLGTLPVAPLGILCFSCIKNWAETRFRSFDLRLSDTNLSWSNGENQCFGLCCWAQRERIVPLEKITDVTWSQSWLQKMYMVDQLNIRTAAGSIGPDGGGSPDISLTGVVDSKRLRDQILSAKARKEQLLGGRAGDGYMGAQASEAPGLRSGAEAVEMAALMERQAVILERLESRLDATAPPAQQTMS